MCSEKRSTQIPKHTKLGAESQQANQLRNGAIRTPDGAPIKPRFIFLSRKYNGLKRAALSRSSISELADTLC